MSEQLKPCPFCGGEAEIKTVVLNGHGGCDLFTWQVRCIECGVQFPQIRDEAIRDMDGIRLVVDGSAACASAWNSRYEERSETDERD